MKSFYKSLDIKCFDIITKNHIFDLCVDYDDKFSSYYLNIELVNKINSLFKEKNVKSIKKIDIIEKFFFESVAIIIIITIKGELFIIEIHKNYSDNSNIRKINIPQSIKKIDYNMFYGYYYFIDSNDQLYEMKSIYDTEPKHIYSKDIKTIIDFDFERKQYNNNMYVIDGTNNIYKVFIRDSTLQIIKKWNVPDAISVNVGYYIIIILTKYGVVFGLGNDFNSNHIIERTLGIDYDVDVISPIRLNIPETVISTLTTTYGAMFVTANLNLYVCGDNNYDRFFPQTDNYNHNLIALRIIGKLHV